MTAPSIPSNSSPLQAFGAHLRDVRLRSPRTVQSYVAVARDFAARAGVADVARADAAAVTAFLGRGGASSVRAGRVRWNIELSALRALHRWSVETGQRTDDPTSGLMRHRVAILEAEPLQLDEMVRLVDAVREHSPSPHRLRNIALVQLFLHTALRVAEVVSLDRGQIDLQAHVIHAVRRKGGKVVSAPVNDVVAEALEHYLGDTQRRRESSSDLALFLSQHGERLSVRTVQQLIASYAKKAGIARRVTPHMLRHSSATQLAILGTPMRVIQDICAHSSIVTTQRYVHSASRDRLDAVDRLGRAFRAQERAKAAAPSP